MIKVQGKIPPKVGVAVSGGLDSMVVLDFLKRKHDVVAFHVSHSQPHSQEEELLVRKYCLDHSIPLFVEYPEFNLHGRSKEQVWREARYECLDRWAEEHAVEIVTCHHLDDCVESWVFSAIRKGFLDVVPYRRGRIIRPFRLNRKSAFEEHAFYKNVPFFEDPTNTDISHDRNFIRHEMMGNILRINPGIHTMVMKKILYEDIK